MSYTRARRLGPVSSCLLLLAAVIVHAAPQSASQVGMRLPDAVSRSVKLGRVMPDKKLSISVCLPFADPQGIAEFNDSVSNPSSPNYRHFLTPEQVGERYGLPYATVQSVAGYLKDQGFKVTLVAKNRLNILAEGTVAQAEKAFGTTIDMYHARSASEPGRQDFFSFSGPIRVPTSLAPYISYVEGLESFTRPVPRAALTPAQTSVLYNTAPIRAASMHGQGRTLGISNWDGYRLTNVPLLYSHFSLPTPAGGVGSNVHEVKLGGGSGTGAPQGEGDLDIQCVLAGAPLCEFYIYDGNGSGQNVYTNVLTQEANDNLCDAISESWGWSLSSGLADAVHNIHVSMTAQGITYMAASGDHGTNLEPYSYPDYDPEVLLVGGTIATTDAFGNRTNEVAWSLDGSGWGGGGGWSTNAATWNITPAWQTGTGVLTGIGKRLGPDIAFHAANGAYQFYLNGSLQNGGWLGTSFACPVFCGLLGVAEQKFISVGGLPADGAGKQRFGRIQDLIYSQDGRTDVWYDITSGNNGNLPNGNPSNCTVKWDTCTGWGCMNVDAFIASLTNPSPTLSSISPNSKPAGSAQFVMTCTGTGYVNGSVVRWNGADLATTFIDATHVTAVVPAAKVVSAGNASVLVHNPTPGGGDSGIQNFTIVASFQDLTIQSGTPGSGVTITVYTADTANKKNGVTPFVRNYATGTAVQMTAPAIVATSTCFDHWEKDGVSIGTNRTITVTMDAVHTVKAVYTPGFILTVNSTNPASGVLVTAFQADANALRNGTTAFTRTYKANTSVSFQAPATMGVNGFARWEKDGVNMGSARTIILPMNFNHTINAIYVPIRTLTVGSQNPNSGVVIAEWITDFEGARDGTTSFTRKFLDGKTASMTAPATAGANHFLRWEVDGVSQGSSRTLSVAMGADHSAVAVYGP